MKPGDIANLLAIREFVVNRISMSISPQKEEVEIRNKLKETLKLLDNRILEEVTSEKFKKSL